VRSGRFYSKCELHTHPVSHILPMDIATCRLKPTGSAEHHPNFDSSGEQPMYMALPQLHKCLQTGVHEAHFHWSHEWERAKQCRNRRDDIMAKPDGWANPLAVVRAKSAADVSGAVKCARRARVDVCARAGAHSFENEGCCPGGVIVDVQDLLEFEYNRREGVVTFGSGFTNGALYYHLHKLGLTFPGGTEGHVGVSGLLLGCGRGMLSQYYGLSCDQIVAVDYVDAEGELRTAAHGSDLLWMAKGAGGNVPAIITAYHSKALEEPSSVHAKYCQIDDHKGERLLRAWSERIGRMSEPAMKMFSHITTFSRVSGWMFDNLCFQCNRFDRRRFYTLVDEVVDAAGGGNCYKFRTTWLEKLLTEPGINAPGNPEALLDNGRWPTDHSNSIMGSWMVPRGLDEGQLYRVIQNAFKEDPPPGGPYTAQLYLYSLTGSKITDVPHLQTAYGGRSAKWVLHWRFFSANNDAVRARHNRFNRDIRMAGLPCKSFYNYIDGDTECHIEPSGMPSKVRWLEAYFSNVPRMQAIKSLP